MWIVRLALRQPYTVAVLAAVILLMGVLSMSSMLVDIFPSIDIPVVAVVWTYPGLSAEDMDKRVERSRRAADDDQLDDGRRENRRLRAELSSTQAVHGAWTVDAGTVRRQD